MYVWLQQSSQQMAPATAAYTGGRYTQGHSADVHGFDEYDDDMQQYERPGAYRYWAGGTRSYVVREWSRKIVGGRV